MSAAVAKAVQPQPEVDRFTNRYGRDFCMVSQLRTEILREHVRLFREEHKTAPPEEHDFQPYEEVGVNHIQRGLRCTKCFQNRDMKLYPKDVSESDFLPSK